MFYFRFFFSFKGSNPFEGYSVLKGELGDYN